MDHGLIEKHADSASVAAAAADDAIACLREAIAQRGQAVWVLAGGTSPMAAYRVIVERYAQAIDWSRVTVAIGDERMVARTDPDSNLGTIAEVLLADPAMALMTQLWPETQRDPADAAARYAVHLQNLPANAQRQPIIDLVWLGVGEDGHTLSLFPGHPDFRATDELVIPVYDAPKAPPTRITLTMAALNAAARVVIFATGAGKKDALQRALETGELPIARVAHHAVTAGARVTWMFDAAASG